MRGCPVKHPGGQAVWVRAREWVLERDGRRCACGARATQVDHIWPRCLAGVDAPENLRAICGPCNLAKLGDPPLAVLPLFAATEVGRWGRPASDPGDLVLARLARERAEQWCGVVDRMLADDAWPVGVERASVVRYRMFDRALKRRGHWADVARWHLNRAEVEARGLVWAVGLPRPSVT